MNTPTTIHAHPLIGSIAMTVEDGERLRDLIRTALLNGHSVVVDFADVTIFTSVFFNVAIGRLYGEFTSEDLQARLTVLHLDQTDQELLQIVIGNAKEYFTNPVARQAVDTLMRRYRETGEI